MTDTDVVNAINALTAIVQFVGTSICVGIGFLAGMYAWRLVMLAKNQSRFF